MHPVVEELLKNRYDEQRSDEWYKLRGNMLTASDAGTALGVNPYESVNDLVLKKCGLGTFKGNQATAHGNTYEDEARDMYSTRFNEEVWEIGLHVHRAYPWLGGSPDGITTSGKLVEIKCPLTRKITNEVPIYYMAQVQLLLEVLNLDEAVFIQYKPSDVTWPHPYEFTVTNVSRDREWWETSLPKFQEVWSKVLWHRKNGCETIMPPPKVKRTSKKRKEEVRCNIDDSYDD